MMTVALRWLLGVLGITEEPLSDAALRRLLERQVRVDHAHIDGLGPRPPRRRRTRKRRAGGRAGTAAPVRTLLARLWLWLWTPSDRVSEDTIRRLRGVPEPTQTVGRDGA